MLTNAIYQYANLTIIRITCHNKVLQHQLLVHQPSSSPVVATVVTVVIAVIAILRVLIKYQFYLNLVMLTTEIWQYIYLAIIIITRCNKVLRNILITSISILVISSVLELWTPYAGILAQPIQQISHAKLIRRPNGYQQ